MLYHLSITNYALIDAAQIDFNPGFTVITGETGAGKSIMLGALSLILGQRSDTSVIRDKEQKCVVEAGFNLGGYGLQGLFEQEDVDYDHETVIRREILPSGKSRAFVNDTPVTLNFLKELSQKLIDIHSQHQNLLLGNYDFQLTVVDTVANNGRERAAYSREFKEWRRLLKERNRLVERHTKQQADRDYWEFQRDQLQEAQLQETEQESLEQELEQLSHVEEIKMGLASANLLLVEHEMPVLDGLHQIHQEIVKISTYLEGAGELSDRLQSTYIELKDIAREIGEKALGLEFDPQRIRMVQDRLDLIYSLQQKHHVDTNKDLLDLLADLNEKLTGLDAFDDELNALNVAISEKEQTLKKLASTLSESRLKVFGTIQKTIETQLAGLGMPNARFKVSHLLSDEFREDGADLIQFLFSANKNGELCDIPKVVSGGEMSRLMLCIKSLLSSAKGLPTIIFDEIDTGVSGEIADRMGRIMQEMAQHIQVISITHLPQIAGKGQHHFKVFKRDTDHQTISEIRPLDEEGRVLEIAGMLSGSELSEAALSNAKDLMR
ncbi:DNA repair protein RecN [Geofilum rubicundum]|uniref:DNA repair protein RecN n=1 Tax=Geofilum rubicundum JCM 15548 TaxID=1236989 RepID=A0A0E9M0L9_9BACT|nr:DNA repair protein RecN [Geofilum rubicundum]GAO30911.1 DNA repair protein RecN [Geofilum rubicundum JCM 15548]